ncbi:unnamed protein product, partial [Iphiclides podalirius]
MNLLRERDAGNTGPRPGVGRSRVSTKVKIARAGGVFNLATLGPAIGVPDTSAAPIRAPAGVLNLSRIKLLTSRSIRDRSSSHRRLPRPPAASEHSNIRHFTVTSSNHILPRHCVRSITSEPLKEKINTRINREIKHNEGKSHYRGHNGGKEPASRRKEDPAREREENAKREEN